MIKENDEESIATEKKDVGEIDSDDDIDDRSEDFIDLEQVSVKSAKSTK